MNRIYQGRVSKVELLPQNGFTPAPAPLEILGDHHQLFQDAINYYLVALAAMASDDESPLGQMRVRMADAWAPFSRNGIFLDGLRASLLRAKVPGITPESSFEEGLIAVLAGNSVEASVLQLAAELLLSKVGGEAAIQQGGRGYWPRFCNPKANPTWDYSPDGLRSRAGKDKLAALIHSELTDIERNELAEELNLSWTVKLQPGKAYEGEKARARLKDAVSFFEKALANPDRRLAGLLAMHPDVAKHISALRPSIDALEKPIVPANRKAAPALVFATLLFKFFPSIETQSLLALHVAKPTANKKPETADRFASLGDDPIRMARGKREYVFPAFTSLSIFGATGPDDIRWGEFDIAAFKEALKTVNQFRLKTEERREKRLKYEAAIAYMEGLHAKWEDPEGAEESEPPHRINGDPRIAEVKKLLEEQVKDLELTDADAPSITLSRRRLRGWTKLTEKFHQIVEPGEPFSTEKARKLKGALAKFQTEHRDEMGDARLFEALVTNRDYWCLWQRPTEAQRAERAAHDWSDNILATYRDYLGFDEEAKRLREPIRFTPADARESRRLFMFSDLSGRSKIKHRKDSLAVEVSVAVKTVGGIWQETRALLHYSAPRLRRDRLRGVEGADNLTEAPWIQPMMEALGLPEECTQDIADHAVALMPEPGKNGLRYLLNFPINVEPEKLMVLLGKQDLWRGQFNGTRDKSIHLHWPSTMDAKYHEKAWWRREKPFTCLAADLGTRACAAIALMEFLPGEPVGQERLIGYAEGKPWKARLLDNGRELLRLPGEDMKILEAGIWKEEPYGSKGRLPDPEETADFERWLKVFHIPVDDYLHAQIENLSFPEQNDRMLRIFRRAQGRNTELNRWLRFLREGDTSRVSEVLQEIGEKESRADWKKWASDKSIAPLMESLRLAILDHQELLKKEIVLLANRILPLRGRRWEWVQREHGKNWILRQTEDDIGEERPKIRGQRGLSIARIEQLEELRRRLQSLNRALQRAPGEKATMGRSARGMEAPDPCPALAEKLDSLKEQRINQTAHLILAKALGVRLKAHSLPDHERRLRDMHGEYEVIPGRKPVDFIVLEDLTRYRTSLDRGPSENSRLMKWCHRAITEKLKQLCEPYGIPVLETPAAYTSKFCSRTGLAGFRAREIGPGQTHFMGRTQRSGPEFAELQKMLDALESAGRTDLRLIVPARGGPRFVAAHQFHSQRPEELTDDADLNAACNLALRAVAAPDMHDLLPRLRCQTENGVLTFVGSVKNPKPSKRDAARFQKPVTFEVVNTSQHPTEHDEDEEDLRRTNIFVDLGKVALFEKVKATNWDTPLATSKGLWGTIRRLEFRYCNRLNRRRLEKWGIPLSDAVEGALTPDPDDEIPM